jgi:hypothetical protein
MAVCILLLPFSFVAGWSLGHGMGYWVFAIKCIAWHGLELVRSWRLDAKIAFWRRVLGLTGYENARLSHYKIDS